MAEYVRFKNPESIYGQKNILHTELELLNVVKKVMGYKRLRQEELVLRLTLKQKMDEINDELKILDKLLPQDRLKGLKDKNSKDRKKERNDVLSLEQEIEIIRRRLEKLNA